MDKESVILIILHGLLCQGWNTKLALDEAKRLAEEFLDE